MKPTRRAVIDVGTNSIKLLIGEVAEGVVHPIDERSDQTRLGAGFYENRELQPGPITATASAVARFVAMARDADAESIRIIATSAARDARNAEDLTRAIQRAGGLRVEIISGEQEAEWVFGGVTSDPVLHGRQLLILDVGGGSTEFIVGDRGRHSFRQSFPIGSVRLLEQFRPGDPPSLAEVAGCRQWLCDFFNREIGPPLKEILDGDGFQNVTLVGTGGTTTILARMEKKLERFERARIEGARLSRRQILDYMVQLWSLSLANRKKIPGLPANRADVIIMGVAIYEAVMQHFNLSELYVSTRGLRYGALLGHAMNVEAARQEFLALMHALEEEPHHVQHVALLAVHLFDEVEDLHGLGDQDRLLLEAASSLHDIGWSAAPDGKGHHRESARIIREHGWKHFKPASVALMAQVARYHRKSLPDLEHEDYAALSPAERLRVQQLASLLRIADGLDRSHQQHIRHLSAVISPGQIVIHLNASRPASREIAAAARKSDLARAVFQREIIFAPQPGMETLSVV